MFALFRPPHKNDAKCKRLPAPWAAELREVVYRARSVWATSPEPPSIPGSTSLDTVFPLNEISGASSSLLNSAAYRNTRDPLLRLLKSIPPGCSFERTRLEGWRQSSFNHAADRAPSRLFLFLGNKAPLRGGARIRGKMCGYGRKRKTLPWLSGEARGGPRTTPL